MNEKKPITVLLVEDLIINQKIIKGLIKSINGNIHTELAMNGEEAYEKAIKNQYDIILMDIQLPVMDGLEATKKIRAFEKDKDHHTPIIAVTALASQQNLNEARMAGVDYQINKPIDPNEFYQILNKYTKIDLAS